MLIFFDFIIMVLISFVPGFILLKNKEMPKINIIILSMVISIAVSSFILYSISLVVAVRALIIYSYIIFLLILLIYFRRDFVNFFNINLKENKKRNEKILEDISLFLLVILIVLLAVFHLYTPGTRWDEYSYHLPMINQYSVNGKAETFNEVDNGYMELSNNFPSLFHAFLGLNKRIIESGLWKNYLTIFFILTLGVIYLISKEIGTDNFYGFTIFGLSSFVIMCARSFYVEIFFTMLFLSGILFLLFFLRKKNKQSLILSAFLFGLLIITKYYGIIFIIIITIYLINKIKKEQLFIFLIIIFLVPSLFFISHLSFFSPDLGLGDYGRPSFQLPHLINNTSLVLSYLFEYFISLRFFPLAVLSLLGIFLLKKPPQKQFIRLALFIIIGFVFLNFFLESTPTFRGFTRYLIPLFAMLCIISGSFIKMFLSKLKNNKVKLFSMLLILTLIFFSSYHLIGSSATFLMVIKYYNVGAIQLLTQNIPNEESSHILFVGANAFVYRFDKAKIYDYHSKKFNEDNVCSVLKENKINYIVKFEIENDSKFKNKKFDENLNNSVKEGYCGIKEIERAGEIAIYKIQR